MDGNRPTTWAVDEFAEFGPRPAFQQKKFGEFPWFVDARCQRFTASKYVPRPGMRPGDGRPEERFLVRILAVGVVFAWRMPPVPSGKCLRVQNRSALS